MLPRTADNDHKTFGVSMALLSLPSHFGRLLLHRVGCVLVERSGGRLESEVSLSRKETENITWVSRVSCTVRC